ncbi:hypothetical protein ABZ260_29825 [Streptosporangium sp. NPDC006013]|uniref:hypothetical protein n=1 Tax=Streptosporangium sp. NPDC006013 TaxID=3155596 RepID=UPI0033BCCC56
MSRSPRPTIPLLPWFPLARDAEWNSRGSVSGSIRVTDTWGNGRGVKVRLQGHRAGTYGDNGNAVVPPILTDEHRESANG